MANRKTGLDWASVSIFGASYLADAQSIRIDVEEKTAEGKGIADIDDWPVLVGRSTVVTMDIQVPSPGTATLMGTAFSTTPNGVGTLAGPFGTVAGTCALQNIGGHTEREGIAVMPITLKFRGVVAWS